MYAIIETGGKQYKVQSGDVIFVEKLNVEDDTKLTIDTVVAVHDDKELKLGSPYVDGATVVTTVLKTGKGKKIRVFTYRRRKGSSRTVGHRQPYTKLQIDEINPTKTKAKAKAEPKAEAKAEVKAEVKAEPKAETKAKAKPKAETKAKAKPKAATKAKAKPKAATKAKAKPKAKTDTKVKKAEKKSDKK